MVINYGNNIVKIGPWVILTKRGHNCGSTRFKRVSKRDGYTFSIANASSTLIQYI